MTIYKVYLDSRSDPIYEGGTMQDCLKWVLYTFGPTYNMGDLYIDEMSIRS